MKFFTVQDISNWFNKDRQESIKILEQQKEQWSQWKKDLENGKSTIKSKDISVVSRKLDQINQQYQESIDLEVKFQENMKQKIENMRRKQQVAQKKIYAMEKITGPTCFTETRLLRAIFGIGYDK